jgi:hypothetical protein
VTVNVELPEPLIEAGTKLTDAPAGNPLLTVKLTVSAKPRSAVVPTL